MSTVKYKMGTQEFSFESDISLKNMSEISVETNVHEEIKNEIEKHIENNKKYIHDIIILDGDQTASIKDFTQINTLKITKNYETH